MNATESSPPLTEFLVTELRNPATAAIDLLPTLESVQLIHAEDAWVAWTGSTVYGRSAAGTLARAGGGYLLGDEGSGYAIGLAAWRAVLRAYDGRGSQTSLTERALGH